MLLLLVVVVAVVALQKQNKTKQNPIYYFNASLYSYITWVALVFPFCFASNDARNWAHCSLLTAHYSSGS